MKKIVVNEKCTGCGICTINSKYLEEDKYGNAIAKVGIFVEDSDIEEVQNVIKNCPEQALTLEEEEIQFSRGRQGALEASEYLKEYAKNYKVMRLCKDDIEFEERFFTYEYPDSDKECEPLYSSKEQAKNAARNEFLRLYYSEEAYAPLLKMMFVDYKRFVLSNYYNVLDTENNHYYYINEHIRNNLADISAKLSKIADGEYIIPDDWKEFSVFPTKDDVYFLEHFDDRSTCSGIITKYKERHSSIDEYMNYFDYDVFEEYETGLFGGTKVKKKWYFTGMSDAGTAYYEHLLKAIKGKSNEIEKYVLTEVNKVLKQYEKNVRKEIEKKAKELEMLAQGKCIQKEEQQRDGFFASFPGYHINAFGRNTSKSLRSDAIGNQEALRNEMDNVPRKCREGN